MAQSIRFAAARMRSDSHSELIRDERLTLSMCLGRYVCFARLMARTVREVSPSLLPADSRSFSS